MNIQDTSKYIINIYQKNNNTWKKYSDGYATIEDNAFGPRLIVSTHENNLSLDNEVVFDKIISNDFRVNYEDQDEYFTTSIRVNNKVVGIMFDRNSSESFENFKKELNQKLSTDNRSQYYTSGNVEYSGEFVNELPHGSCTYFYDGPDFKVKFKGEFENGEIDGGGIFYSRDGKIRIKINNISNGVPNGYCRMLIRTKEGTDLKKTFNYDDLRNTYNVHSNEFCYNIARNFLPNIDRVLFESLELDTRISIVNEKLDRVLALEAKLDAILESQNKSRGLIRKLFSLIW